jgi:hypothetical protein
MIEIFSGLFISGVGVIHDLVKTYADLNTWQEEDLRVDGEWLELAMEKGVLPPDDYTWSREDKIPTRELRGTHEVVVAVNADKKIKYRIRQGESMILTHRVAAKA